MIPVKPHIAERAHIKSLAEYQEMYRRSVEEPEAFWRERSAARRLVLSAAQHHGRGHGGGGLLLVSGEAA